MGHQSKKYVLCVLTLLHAGETLRLLSPPLENDLAQWEIERESLASNDLVQWEIDREGADAMFIDVITAADEEGSVNDPRNLCMDGHLVPEFFLLGAMKTSTSTLAANIHESKDIIFPTKDGKSIKELHFFDAGVSLKDKDRWLSYYPKCSFKHRVVATDCSPAYIRKSSAAELMKDFYGAEIGKSLKFALMLREPLARAQSAFHHHQNFDGQISQSYSFNEFVEKYIKDGTDRSEVMWGSQYVEQLQAYFKIFEPAQFWIVPFGCNLNPSSCGMTISFTETLWNELGVSPGEYDVSKFTGHPRHLNRGLHPTLDEDLNNDTLQNAMNKFRNIAPDMANLLANSSAKLFGYTGGIGDKAAIEKWLTNGW